jgi:hypothetical protein
VTVVIGVVSMVLAIRNRQRVFEPIAEYPAFMAGIWGGFFGIVIGSLTNDSGPVMFEIGFLMLLMATGYARSKPVPVRVPVAS